MPNLDVKFWWPLFHILIPKFGQNSHFYSNKLGNIPKTQFSFAASLKYTD